MSDYRVSEIVLDVAPDALLLDTNVMVDAFSGQDNPSRREYAELFLRGCPVIT